MRQRETTATTTTRCESCRKVRRACRGAEGGVRWPCLRCSQRGERCNGPASDGRGKGPRQPVGAKLLELRLALTPQAIGPSSFSQKLNMGQLTFALSFHLIHTYLSLPKRGVIVSTLAVDPLETKFGSVGGRASELPLVEELAIQTFMLRGSRISSHSAILGERLSILPRPEFDDPSPLIEISECGLARRPLQNTLLETIKRLIGQIVLETPNLTAAAAVEGLYTASTAFTCLQGLEQEEEQARLRSELFLKGLPLLDRPDFTDLEKDRVRGYLTDMVRGELTLSFFYRRTSLISLKMYQRVFPPDPPEGFPPFHQLSQQDLDLVFSEDPETLFAFYHFHSEPFLNPILTRLDSATRRLHYDKNTLLSVCTTWKMVEAAFQYTMQVYEDLGRIVLSRSSADPVDTPRRPRLGRFMTWVMVFSVAALELFQISYGVVFRDNELEAKGREELLKFMEVKLDRVLLDLSRAVQIRLLANGKNELEERATALKLSEALEDRDGPRFVDWCARHPQEARVFLRVVTYSSYSSPDAARRALDIREAIESAEYQSPGLSETSEEAVSRLVGGALEEVIFGGSLPERIVEAALEDVMG